MPTARSDVTNLKRDWVPDSAVTECKACDKRFGTLTRKHHCRICGNVFCAACSVKRVTKGLGGEIFAKPQRACLDCYTQIFTQRTDELRKSVARPGASVSLPSPTDTSESESESEQSDGDSDSDSSLSAGEQLEGYAARYIGGGATAAPLCKPATHQLVLRGVGAIELPIVPLPGPELGIGLDESLESSSRAGVCPLVLQHCGVRFGATVGKALATELRAFAPSAVLGMATGNGTVLSLETARGLKVDQYCLATKAESGLEPHQQQTDLLEAPYDDANSRALVKNEALQLDKRCSLHGTNVAVVLDMVSTGETLRALLRLAREAGATVVAIGVMLEVNGGGWQETLDVADVDMVKILGSVPKYSIASDGTATADGVAEPAPEPASSDAPKDEDKSPALISKRSV